MRARSRVMALRDALCYTLSVIFDLAKEKNALGPSTDKMNPSTLKNNLLNLAD